MSAPTPPRPLPLHPRTSLRLTTNLYHRRTGVLRATADTPKSGKRGSSTAGSMHIKLTSTVKGASLRAAVVCGDEVWTGHGTHISIRSAATGAVQHTLDTDAHHSIIWSLLVVGNYVWAGTSTGPINIYSMRKKKLVKVARRHTGGVHSLATGLDSERVWSGSNDFTCIMWNGQGEFLKLYAGHSNGVRCTLTLGPLLWTGSDDHTIRVWDTNRCECTDVLTGHSDSVLNLCAGEGGTSIWSASTDGTLRSWALQAPHACTQIVEVGQRVNCLTPVGQTMWSCGAEPLVRVWRTHDFANVRALKGHSSFVGSVLQVRRTETHVLWSYGVGDKLLNIWRQETASGGGRDSGELLAMAQAANKLYEPMLEAVEQERSALQSDRAALESKLAAADSRLAAVGEREDRVAAQAGGVGAAMKDLLTRLAHAQAGADEVKVCRAVL